MSNTVQGLLCSWRSSLQEAACIGASTPSSFEVRLMSCADAKISRIFSFILLSEVGLNQTPGQKKKKQNKRNQVCLESFCKTATSPPSASVVLQGNIILQIKAHYRIPPEDCAQARTAPHGYALLPTIHTSSTYNAAVVRFRVSPLNLPWRQDPKRASNPGQNSVSHWWINRDSGKAQNEHLVSEKH